MTEITLCIEPQTGKLYLETGEKEETPTQEGAEGETRTLVPNLAAALSAIKRLATQAMGGDGDGMDTENPIEDSQEQEGAAMSGSFRGRGGMSQGAM